MYKNNIADETAQYIADGLKLNKVSYCLVSFSKCIFLLSHKIRINLLVIHSQIR